MLTIDAGTLGDLEKEYPGISVSIHEYEMAKLPTCLACRSKNTAKVVSGLIGRSISIAAATTKIKLVTHAPKAGEHFCNSCQRFFN